MEDMSYTDGLADRVPARAAANPRQLTKLVYRSRASDDFEPATLPDLVTAAQVRNRAEGLTGTMVYDAGQFLQWLEGPRAALDRVAGSIRADTRHGDIETICERTAKARAFADWTMMLALRGDAGDAERNGAMRAPSHALDNLLSYPEAAPSLLRVLFDAPAEDRSAAPDEAREERNSCADELVRLFTTSQGEVTPDRVEALCRCAHGVEEFAALYDQTARALGDLWLANKCSGADITMALCEMQIAYRRLRQHRMIGPDWEAGEGRALVAQTPGDPHIIGAIVKADVLRARGWQADVAFPETDADLAERLARTSYDVIVLATSRVLPNAGMLPGVGALIERIRRVAKSPSLTVVVGGRAFADDREAWHDVGADAACASPVELADVLEGLRTPGA